MGFGRASKSRARVRGFMPTGEETLSLHGTGRLRLPAAMTPSQISKLNIETKKDVAQTSSLRPASQPTLGDDLYNDEPESPGQDFLDVLDGNSFLDISHGGGEFGALRDESTSTKAQRSKRRKDNRERRDRLLNHVEGFEAQLEEATQVYMRWNAMRAGESLLFEPNIEAGRKGDYEIQVLDTYCTYRKHIHTLSSDSSTLCAILKHGLVPNAPLRPSYAISIRALETYRTTHLRSPHFAIEPFVKVLCDLYGVAYRTSLRDVFSTAYDFYLRIREEVDARVMSALGRDGLWRRKNACSACTYKLDGEEKLEFSMLTTMDGNDSLKRIIRRALKDLQDIDGDEGPETAEGASTIQSKEREDGRHHQGSYYIGRASTEKFKDDGPTGDNVTEAKAPGDSSVEGDDSPCQDRWQNMSKEATERAWGIFDETGIFLCLCRHGFVLAVLDMIRSGELSKYPLAVVEALIDSFGEDIGCGYDIGCQFSTTLRTSCIGEKAAKANFRCLVGSFHGHAHNRLCQLSNLATYVKGLGLEDLEGCERFFSRSNALASALRYASIFHRIQKIAQYLQHCDETDTMQNLSKFLVDNYHQALKILASEDALLANMKARGFPDTSVFQEWLDEERKYLKSLKREPEEETVKLDYYQKLLELDVLEEQLREMNKKFVIYNPLQAKSKEEKAIEKRHRNVVENIRRVVEVVQTFEHRLGIERWTKGSDEWVKHEKLFIKRRYQRCLDNLERLVVSRMFELTKMNMSGTGYKMRKHIAKALQARSQAIRTALERYNAAALSLSPPRPKLSWDQVVEYAFLADFDLLRDTREDVRERPWARPANRVLMDQHFKILRAREEIKRLNVEIKRVITHIQDEENYLLDQEEKIHTTDPILAYHVGDYRIQRTRFSSLHLSRFSKLSQLPGFTGSIIPGTSLDKTMHRAPKDNAAMQVDARKPAVEEGWEDVDGDGEPDVRLQDNLDLDEVGDMETAFRLFRMGEDDQ